MMLAPSRNNSHDSAESLRKRVCKACDRCRLKKSKCDGSNPCSRCITDNTICVFGERKKSQDKIYPKGYVEMLEQQQAQLVAGIQELYHRSIKSHTWNGTPLQETNGYPLTHDVLAALNLLEKKQDGSGEVEAFEVDVDMLQRKLLLQGSTYPPAHTSYDSDDEHSLRHAHSRSGSHGTPMGSIVPPITKQEPVYDFKEMANPNFTATMQKARASCFNTASSSPVISPSSQMPSVSMPTSQMSSTQIPSTHLPFNTGWQARLPRDGELGWTGFALPQGSIAPQFTLQQPPQPKRPFMQQEHLQNTGNNWLGYGTAAYDTPMMNDFSMQAASSAMYPMQDWSNANDQSIPDLDSFDQYITVQP